MSGKETALYSYSPREAAKAFLKDAIPSYIPVEGSRYSNPPKDSQSITDMLGRITIDEESPIVKVRYLSKQPVAYVAFVISDVDTGLTPEQERFVLYNTASSCKVQAEAEIMHYEMFGRPLYGNLDKMRDFASKRPKSNATYIQEKKAEVSKLQHLMDNLMQTISNSPQSKEH